MLLQETEEFLTMSQTRKCNFGIIVMKNSCSNTVKYGSTTFSISGRHSKIEIILCIINRIQFI